LALSPQKKATIVSTSVAAFLTILKLVFGVLSGSVAVLASAVDSVLDMLTSAFNFFAVSRSEKEADEHFNYGHGKTEALASVFEGAIIAVSGLFLLYHAIDKAFSGEVSSYMNEALIVMVISLVVTIALVTYLNSVAKKTKSMVIKADALHYKTDVYVNVAVLVSLGLVYLTGYEIVDAIVGGGIALFIIYSAYELIQEGVLVLLDRALPNETVEQIKNIIDEEEMVKKYHFLRTRQAGNDIFVEVHLVFPISIALFNAHEASDRIEEKIAQLIPEHNWIFNCHLDPYDDSHEENHR
jgi:ferrous-iron efflux pump FieF